MASIVQKGQPVVIGFNSYEHSDMVMEEATLTIIGDIEEIRNNDNETATKLISNPGTRIVLTGNIKSGKLGTFTSLVKGDRLTINGIGFMLEDIEIRFARTQASITLKAVKEESMTY